MCRVPLTAHSLTFSLIKCFIRQYSAVNAPRLAGNAACPWNVSIVGLVKKPPLLISPIFQKAENGGDFLPGAVDRLFACFIFFLRPHQSIERGQRTTVCRECNASGKFIQLIIIPNRSLINSQPACPR